MLFLRKKTHSFRDRGVAYSGMPLRDKRDAATRARADPIDTAIESRSYPISRRSV
jgi:hypothetical protein